MHPYIAKLKSQLAENPPNYGYTDAHSLLEMLYLWYTEWNPINSEEIRSGFFSLQEDLAACTDKQLDSVMDTVSSLCAQHERLAFLEGIRVGIRLAAELET